MQDYLAQVEKLRKDAADCALIRDLQRSQPSASCLIGSLIISRPLQTRLRWQCSNERQAQSSQR